MATHSSVLAWRIPGMVGSLVGCRLWGLTESDTTEATQQQQQQQYSMAHLFKLWTCKYDKVIISSDSNFIALLHVYRIYKVTFTLLLSQKCKTEQVEWLNIQQSSGYHNPISRHYNTTRTSTCPNQRQMSLLKILASKSFVGGICGRLKLFSI